MGAGGSKSKKDKTAPEKINVYDTLPPSPKNRSSTGAPTKKSNVYDTSPSPKKSNVYDSSPTPPKTAPPTSAANGANNVSNANSPLGSTTDTSNDHQTNNDNGHKSYRKKKPGITIAKTDSMTELTAPTSPNSPKAFGNAPKAPSGVGAPMSPKPKSYRPNKNKVEIGGPMPGPGLATLHSMGSEDFDDWGPSGMTPTAQKHVGFSGSTGFHNRDSGLLNRAASSNSPGFGSSPNGMTLQSRGSTHHMVTLVDDEEHPGEKVEKFAFQSYSPPEKEKENIPEWVTVALGDLLGSGSFGEVYMGRREDTGEMVAVKSTPNNMLSKSGPHNLYYGFNQNNILSN